MSQYIHFFVRRDKTFVELGCYSRSCRIYQAFCQSVPYEHISLMTKEILDDVAEYLGEEQTRLMNEVRKQITRYGTVATLNAPVNEILDAMDETFNSVEDLIDLRDEAVAAGVLVGQLQDMTDNQELIYAGIECGSEVTLEDII